MTATSKQNGNKIMVRWVMGLSGSVLLLWMGWISSSIISSQTEHNLLRLEIERKLADHPGAVRFDKLEGKFDAMALDITDIKLSIERLTP